MKKLITISFIALLISCNSNEEKPVTVEKVKADPACQAFQKNSNGSWTSTGSTTIQGPNGAIQINPGVTFAKGVAFMGVDLASWLDEHCQKK